MALFAVDVEKQLGTELWTNRYLIEADDIVIGNGTAQAIADLEQTFHYNLVEFVRVRIRDTNPATDVFITTPLSGIGAITPSSTRLPLWNVVRVDFPSGFGRPSRKFYRLPVCENDVNNDSLILSTPALTALAQAMSDFALLGIRDPQGVVLGEGVIFPDVAMRQLRRGSKRRTTPIL